MMKPNISIVCVLYCLLLASCSHNNVRTSNTPERPISAAGNGTNLVYCWFVEDNGAGHRGYVFLDVGMNRAMTPSETLYSTLEELREALRRGEGEPLFLVPKYPGWVPEGWRVRNLSSNEVNRLGSSLKLTILKE
jgi:hypothetical protein